MDHPRLRIVPFEARNRVRFLLWLPATLISLWQQIGLAALVHTGVAGWPWPIGWAASLFARIRHKPLVIVVESSFWRLAAGERANLRRRIGSLVWEQAARACLARADYAAFTHPAYQKSLPALRASGGVIAPATWIDQNNRLNLDQILSRWDRREEMPAAMLFASRLVPEKGARVVLEALRFAVDQELYLRLDVIGSGADLHLFQKAASDWAADRVRLFAPIPYGSSFFDFLDNYRAVIVPVLGDEQPRIVLDAAARGIATVVSDRSGVASLVKDGSTGLIVPAGDAVALAAALSTAGSQLWRERGVAAYKQSAMLTHQAMHAQRSLQILDMLERKKFQPSF